MTRIPQVLGLVLCEKMHVDPQAGKTSLLGLFASRRFEKFPTPPQLFTVYSVLYDGVGEGIMELILTRLEDEKDIYTRTWWHRLPGRGYLVNLERKVDKCAFPHREGMLYGCTSIITNCRRGSLTSFMTEALTMANLPDDSLGDPGLRYIPDLGYLFTSEGGEEFCWPDVPQRHHPLSPELKEAASLPFHEVHMVCDGGVEWSYLDGTPCPSVVPPLTSDQRGADHAT